jgi:hypothetical protein
MIKKQTPVTLQYAFPPGSFVFAFGNSRTDQGLPREPVVARARTALGNERQVHSRTWQRRAASRSIVNFYFDYYFTLWMGRSVLGGGQAEEMTKTVRAHWAFRLRAATWSNAGHRQDEFELYRWSTSLPAQKAGIFSLIYGMPCELARRILPGSRARRRRPRRGR